MTLPALIDATGRVAFVSGAAGGIGRATGDLFSAAGASVAGFDANGSRLPAPGERFLPIAGDATDEAAVRDAVRQAVERFGRIDFVVGAVGATGSGGLADTSLAEWRRLLEVNLTSAFLIARECHPHLTRPGGALVLISSTNGRNGGSALSGAAYAVAKAGVLNLVRHLAKAWAGEGLRVNALAPGPVSTPMLNRLSAAQHAALRETVPLKRYAEPAEIAAAVAYLCSPHAATMTGACINVSGGLVLD